jgi:hypothetical protein
MALASIWLKLIGGSGLAQDFVEEPRETVHPGVVGKVGRARRLSGRAAGLSAEREGVRPHMVANRCGGWVATLYAQKTKLLFWLFMVIFG